MRSFFRFSQSTGSSNKTKTFLKLRTAPREGLSSYEYRDGVPFDYASDLLESPNNRELEIIDKGRFESDRTGEKIPRSENKTTSVDNYTTTPSAKSQEEISRNSDRTDSSGRELSEGQQEYFKDSKIRDDEGRLQVVYHGTEADFTVFDTSVQGGKNGEAEGFGIYITPSKAVTEHYGERQMEMYANITKPARSDIKTIGVTKLAKLIESTARAEARPLLKKRVTTLYPTR